MEPETYEQYLNRLHCGQVSFESLANTVWLERFEHKEEIAKLRLKDARKEDVIRQISEAESIREVKEIIEDFKI